MVKRLTAVMAIVAMLVAMTGLGPVLAYHEDDVTVHEFADERFEARWARTDEPVASDQVDRTWIWGPSPYTPGMMEPYNDSPDGERLVQYFDKSRMELNDPDTEDTSLWAVTQGLLARDLMRGWIQMGDEDDDIIEHSEGPSTENVAGDVGPNNGPTYATMGELIDADAREEGAEINERLEQDGTITAAPSRGVTAAHRVTVDWIDHTVASVFWDFMNSSGLIWDGSGYSNDQLFENPFYATGLPLTEAYWTWVSVDGTEKDVLIQCFERRCLTYTPDNEPGWRVEAGNVGQHYYRWLQTHEGMPGPELPFDVVATDLNQPRGTHVGPDGTVFVAESGTGGETCATFGEGEEAFEACAGMTGSVTAYLDGEQWVYAEGLPSVGVFGEATGPNDVFVTDSGEVYVVIGLGGNPDDRALLGDDGLYLGWVLQIHEDGSWTPVVDIAAYEATNNPDEGMIDSNPYSLVVTDEGMAVSDAGANALLWVDNDLNVSTLAVFPPIMMLAPPFMELPEGTEIPAESVPTGVALGPDGAFYVGELTGFPFEVGAAQVWRVTTEGEATVYAEGFTNIVDVAFDNDGHLLVLEFTSGGLLSLDEADPATAVGALYHIDGEGVVTVVLDEGLVVPAGVAVAADDSIYVTNFSVVPGMSQLVHFTA